MANDREGVGDRFQYRIGGGVHPRVAPSRGASPCAVWAAAGGVRSSQLRLGWSARLVPAAFEVAGRWGPRRSDWSKLDCSSRPLRLAFNAPDRHATERRLHRWLTLCADTDGTHVDPNPETRHTSCTLAEVAPFTLRSAVTPLSTELGPKLRIANCAVSAFAVGILNGRLKRGRWR